ncbi:MAG: efflux RND transporter periplasmic adaptor subunit [Kangiellaceae bacterium]|nr:efflux RND transporter periplasmic adaptor subunit [Kangiellaceae bacterium]
MFQSIFKRLPSLITILFFIALLIYLQWPPSEKEKQNQPRVTDVKTATANQAEFKDVVEALGTAIANEQLQITTKYADVVQAVFFKDGQKVNKGDTLVQLDRQEEIARVEEMEANRAEAMVQLTRLQDLLSKKATSKSQVDQQEAKTKAIDAQLMIAKIRLNDTTIKAPFSGNLGFRQISVGALLAPGDLITSLDDISRVKVDFAIPERFLTSIKLGQDIEATNDAYLEEVFHGKITSIAPRIDPITRTLKVRAEIANTENKLRPGMLLKVEVFSQIETVLQIPESAILPIEDKHFVFVIQDNKAVQKEVVLGRRKPGIVEIIEGVTQSEQVVVKGTLKLRDGSVINVLED